jgi:hypothetical protein
MSTSRFGSREDGFMKPDSERLALALVLLLIAGITALVLRFLS